MFRPSKRSSSGCEFYKDVNVVDLYVQAQTDISILTCTMFADVADCWPTATQIKNHSCIIRRSLLINLSYAEERVSTLLNKQMYFLDFTRASIVRRTFHLLGLMGFYTDPSGRTVQGVGPRPFLSCDCGFESRRGHGCLFLVGVLSCQVEVSAAGWSLVQRSPAELCIWVWSWILDNEEAVAHWVCCAMVKNI